MFLKADTVATAIEKLQAKSDFLKTQEVSLANALGRILASDVVSTEQAPYFARSVVDGYAVRVADITGASMEHPVALVSRGYIPIGTLPDLTLNPGECVEIATGGAIPQGADAVAMVEYCEVLASGHIAIGQSLKPGQHIVPVGDDFQADTLLLNRGTTLSPYDLGLLAAAGIGQVSVFVRPRLSLLVTGSELVSPTQPVVAGKVRDINSVILTALATSLGYEVVSRQLLPDDDETIESALREACITSDIVLLSGGSSKGKADNNRQIIDNVTGGGVFTHGLGLKPGKPTILAHDLTTHTLIAGLPGNPMSASVVFMTLFETLLQRLTGSKSQMPLPVTLAETIKSDPGKRTLILCHLLPNLGEPGYTAKPIVYRSANVHSLSQADGYIILDEKTYELPAGTSLWVHPL